MEVYRKSFSFHSTRYEEWMNGQCINGDLFETDIVAQAGIHDIQFYITDIGELEIDSCSSFEFEDESTELILDRIIYNHTPDYIKPNEPIECQLFREISGISCIRFTMSSPLRVIEFYGSLTKVGQASKIDNKNESKILDSTKIINDLEFHNRLSPDNLMQLAVKEFEKHSDVSSLNDAKAVAECLKLFVEVYSLLNSEYIATGEMPVLMSKVYFFIALCNYKIGNNQQAYIVAKAAGPIIEQIIDDSVFSNLPKEMLGADEIETLLSQIKSQDPNIDVKIRDISIVDPTIVDTGILDSIAKNDIDEPKDLHIYPKEIEFLLDQIEYIQDSLDKLYEKKQKRKILEAKEKIEKYRFPCYFAWYCVDNVIRQDLRIKEDDTEIFEFFDDIYSFTNNLIIVLNDNSPFSRILKNDEITSKAIALYRKILHFIENNPKSPSSFMALLNGKTNEYELDIPEAKTSYCTEDFSPEVSRLHSIVDIVNTQTIEERTNSRVPEIMPEVLLFKSNEHQRYENGNPVRGLQHCLRTIQIEINDGTIKEYLVKPDDGFIVRVYNDDVGTAQMSAKPMRIHRKTDNVIELRGYPVHAITPFGWQMVDYSTYSFLVFFNNGEICQCAMCMLDRGVVIVYRYNSDKQIENK